MPWIRRRAQIAREIFIFLARTLGSVKQCEKFQQTDFESFEITIINATIQIALILDFIIVLQQKHSLQANK